ncbi:MAG TPA: TolC family protein [Thermoanaerobaculia bacterium]|nr:TolC family protein [Thermoanaerobaculia bacterium]
MRFELSVRAAGIALLAILAAAPSGVAQAPSQTRAERPITLTEAVALALANNEDILVERESLVAAEAAVSGAQGAYDPLLQLDGGWRQSSLPVNSAFSGAPPGRLAPTVESTEANAGVSQLLPTGGVVAVRGAADRTTTDGLFDLLSPSYGTGLGVEFRQPLLRDRTIDGARFQIRVAAADRERAAAGVRREVTDTVAEVERAYWTLVAARRELGVRQEAVGLAGEQLSETDIRIESGSAPETEVAQPRAELERRRGELLAATEAAARAENALKLLILGDGGDGGDSPAGDSGSDSGASGRPSWGDRLVPAEEAEPTVTPVDVEAAMARALDARPELAAFEAAVERRRIETALAVDAVRPALDAVVSHDRFGLAGSRNRAATPVPGVPGGVPGRLQGNFGDSLGLLADGDFDDTRVGLVFSYPIGNRQARAGAAIARTVERQAEADLTRARKGVRAEVLDAAAALDTAGQRIAAARAGREAAEVQLMAERERYGAGMTTNFLVLTRQNDLSRARLEEIAAQTDYRRAATELARVTGALLQERGIVLEERDIRDEQNLSNGTAVQGGL